MKTTLRALFASALLALMLTGTAHAQGAKVLVFHGPPDETTTAGVAALKAIGTANDLVVDEAADATAINTTNLENYRALVFLNTAGNLLTPEQEGAVERFMRDGNGFLGIGSAAQGESGAFFTGLIGARPTPGTSTETTSQLVVPGDRAHPATKALPLLWTRSDVWYKWNSSVTGKLHVVARYRGPDTPAGDATKGVEDNDTPISWCRDYSGGRSFYTGMGRTAAAFAEPDFRAHLTGALRWSAGVIRGDCKATIYANYKGTKIMSAGAEATGLTTSGESHGIATADNGWMLYIGRGDCRTDAERGSLLGLSTLARTLDHADPNVGIGCGSVHIYDPSKSDGTLNSGVSLAGTLAVYGDGGQGDERVDGNDHKMEYGLLGVAPDPHFSENGWVYLQYFPTFNPNSVPPGLPAARRSSKLSQPRISRFKIDLQSKKLDLASEKIIFQYDAQIFSCCHVGGGMGFDSTGNLYVTTGDTNSSQGSDGYSGNNPSAHCPTGPVDPPTSKNCGDAGFSFQDARRTAGNTNDYNGKMLRFNPREIPDASPQPTVGAGSTYDVPGADAPNGPNLFDGTEGGGGKAKPEIYAMGLRNPSRLSIDPKTDVPYSAWVGPDAGAPSGTLGPSTYENAAQISHAGNYGWPYCMGNKQPYRDRLADGAVRTTNAPGYVSGGPAQGGTDGWYDCNNLHNDSPNNTGLVELPHTTGTGMDAGTVRGNNLWYSRGNPDDHNGCPDFPRDRGDGNAPNYSATPVELCPYAENQGMTIMDGPVYRYNAEATDNSKRWPAYWDGRWFLHNNGGPSIKHGLMLDPATADKAGLPIYADSLRDMLTWNDGSYMDSKFGTDGALYVQTYDGFFRAGPGVSIYRYDYVGGAPTPNAAPRAIPIGDYEVKFSRAASGGVSWAWDFGDGQTSTDPKPTHRYAEAKRYTVKLTVTYADDSTDTSETTVDVIAAKDTTAPTTTAELTPREPGAGGTYARAVKVALTAADAAGGSGVDRIEYRLDDGAWLTYGGPIEQSRPGAYRIEFRATDQAGNVEAPKSVSFTIAVPENCTPNLNDEFDGPLDPKWTVLRGDDTWRTFDEGRLRITVRNGDMIGDQATAKNVLLQDAPDDDWQATTRLDVSTLTEEGDQAGFVLWNGEDPNTFAKITYISKGSYAQWEWVATREGESDIHSGGTQFAPVEGDAYLRLSTNGDGKYIAEGSTDGETYTQISDPIEDLGDPKTIKVGLKVSNGQDSTSRNAGFDYFRMDCADRIPPQTTATLEDDTPQGEPGWYSRSPEVTLEATDGAGDGVGKIEYKVDGGAARTYEAPFTVDTDGDHEIQYYATDNNGNVEPAKTVELRVDGNAPTSTATATVDQTTASASVKIDAEDGTGSGIVLTEYRVDGGPWKTYRSTQDQLLDGSQATFDQWKHAGGGGFERLTDGSGGITPLAGDLGMLWYPVKAYGDFRLKLQFREGRTDSGFSNGGVFVRFPDPEQDPRADECAKQAGGDDAWVAIYCGHEIQLWDGGTSEPQKTGSVYNFKPVGEGDDSKKGQWEDYEIEVRGQQYTIRRNGTVINQFDNRPGQTSSRPSDPPTTLRQFARGYIGLQNHSDADKMQYRNVRVENLSAGDVDAPQPFRVDGAGPHTIEVRSIDAAGNVEAKGVPLAFEIGAATPEGSTQTVVPTVPPAPVSPIIPPMAQPTATAKLGTVASRITRAAFAKRGVAVQISCTGAMDGTAKLTVSSSVAKQLKLARSTLASSDAKCWGPHSIKVSLKPSSALAKALARKGGPKSVKATLTVQMRVFGKQPQTLKKTITLRR